MFTKDRNLDTSNSKLAYDKTTGKPFLLSHGLKHWISGTNTISRCGFDLSKAASEDLTSYDMGKVISLDAND